MPGPAESARMLVMEKRPLMMPKESPDTVGEPRSGKPPWPPQPRAWWAQGRAGELDAARGAEGLLTVSHLSQGDWGLPILAEDRQPFIRLPAPTEREHEPHPTGEGKGEPRASAG